MIDVKDIERLGKIKEKENYRFRTFLKCNVDEEELDKQFKELHNKYFKIYDCNKCRNCCKKLGLLLTKEEFDNICNKYNCDKNKFEKYGIEEQYTCKSKRCIFLDENNNCKLKDDLPISCKDYPYTDKEERLWSLLSIVSNASVCPVVYEILEELKDIYSFKKR